MEIRRENITLWLKELQDTICAALEEADGTARFEEENWRREEGGGGRSRIMRGGKVIEKGGVLYSAVHGQAPDFLFKEKQHSSVESAHKEKPPHFFATGISIVLHPQNPMVPIIHMNIRYFEMEDQTRWLGGGIDLTPHYIFEEDAHYFHTELKKVCDAHHPAYYNKFKTWADDYFYIPHRKETRGVGGIFFDRLNQNEEMSFEKNFLFWQNVGRAFAPIYCELIRRNKSKIFTPNNKQWQLLRRGRYVEFNLIYDKGTKFGIETNGRVESVLMSLPATAGWEHNFEPKPGSEEEKTLGLLKKAINWLE